MPQNRKKGAFYNIILVLVTLLLLFLTIEIIARLAGYTSLEFYDADDHVIWKLRPNQVSRTKIFAKQVKIDDKGFRSDPFNENKPANIYRIISFGDSTTYGWGVDINDTYHQVAKKILNNSGMDKKIEWINAGVCAYNLYQELGMFKSCLKYHPDMITVSTTWNEYWNFESLSKSELEHKKLMVKVKSFLRRFAAFNLFVEVKGAWVYLKLRDKILVSEIHGGSENLEKNQLAFFRSHVKEFISICQQQGIRLVFINLNPPDTRTRILFDEAKAAGLDTLDFFPIVDRHRIGNAELGIYDSHPTPKGHELIGRALADYMSKSVFGQI